jgi:hypothetical protein
MREQAEPTADGVANDAWQRVRDLAERMKRYEAAAADGDEEAAAQAERLRVRTARATEKAQLADGVADSIADIERRRKRG